MRLCYSIGVSNRDQSKAGVLQGTLDLMVLQTLDSLGSLHGYAIAARLEQVSGGALQLNMGTLYPALMRLEQRGLLRGTWGTTDSNRKARFYALTPAGRRQLAKERQAWDRMADIIHTLLRARRKTSGATTCVFFANGCNVLRVRSTDAERDEELQQELRLHLQLAAEDAQRQGETPGEAARAAGIRAGSVSQSMDELRDQRGLPWLDDVTRDVRHGLRMLRRIARLHGRGGSDARARHRRQHRDLLDRERGDPSAVRIPRARSVDVSDDAVPRVRVRRILGIAA